MHYLDEKKEGEPPRRLIYQRRLTPEPSITYSSPSAQQQVSLQHSASGPQQSQQGFFSSFCMVSVPPFLGR